MLTSTRKRPRRRSGVAAMKAMFIWSNQGMFGEKNDEEDKARHANDDDDDEDEDVRELSGEGYDHPVFGKTWAYQVRPDEISDEKDDEDAYNDVSSAGAKVLLKKLERLTKGADDIDRIRRSTSEDAADAFRRIVIGIFGTIPGDAFEVIVNTDQAGVQRLMQSALATGYALRNAEWRMMMADSMALPAVKSVTADENEPDYMRDVPKRGSVRTAQVSGVVHWWDGVKDVRAEMSAAEYVAKLEAENELLKSRLNAKKLHGADDNRILDYMKTVAPEKIASLQTDMGADALECFKVIIRRTLGNVSSDKVSITYSTSRDYISQLSFWCLLVGYHVRNIEKKLEMSRMLQPESTVSATDLDDSRS